MYLGQQEDTGVWRDLSTGVDPVWADPTLADGALDQPGDPGAPVHTRLEGPWGLPWYEGLEDPSSPMDGMPLLQSPEPTYPDESVGAEPLPGAYDGAYRTHGPVRAWGHEPSGGLYGDQAIGRIQRFPANIPDRYDPNGVWNVDYRDELAAVIAANEAPLVTDTDVTTSLVQYPYNTSMY